MSTGDMSDYMRGKMEVRRHGAKRESFMKDGFHKWAESSLPAREGQDEKEPAEKTDSYISMPGYGDKNASSLGYGRRGGAGTYSIADVAANARTVYDTAKVVVPVVRGLVKEKEFRKIVGNQIAEGADKVLEFLGKIGLGKHRLSPRLASMVRKRTQDIQDGKLVMKGGDMPSVDQIIETAKKVIQWLRDHKKEVHQALDKEIPDFIDYVWAKKKVKDPKTGLEVDVPNSLSSTSKSIGQALTNVGLGKPNPVMVKHAQSLLRKGLPHGEIVALIMKDHYMTKPEALKVLKLAGGRIGMGHEDSSSEDESCSEDEEKGKGKVTDYVKKVLHRKGGKAMHLASAEEKKTVAERYEGGRIGMGRKPSAFALYVKKYAAEHPGLGRSLMKEAAAAYKKCGGAKTPLRESEDRLEEKARGKDFTEAKALRLAKKAGKSESAYMEGGHGHRPQDDEYTFHGHPDSRVHDPSSGMKSGRGGRKPSAYALFVKEYSKKHPGLGKSLMKEAAAAWKAR